MSRTISHWRLLHGAIAEAETRYGRYLTAPEVEKVHQGATSKHWTARELRAVKRIWPGMQLEFKLGRHSG